MITKSIKFLLAGLLFMNIAALTSCKDDDLSDPNRPSKTTQETELARSNNFYKLDVSNSLDWKVAKYPEWVGIMNEEGTAGEQLQIFVEENGDDLDRRDTIVVVLDDNSLVRMPLRQNGLAREGENDEAELLTDKKQLILTYGVGYCTDVLKSNPNKAMKYYVLNKSPFNYAKLLAALKNAGEADAAFSEPLYSSRYESVTGTSTSGISNQLGVNAGIEVGIKAFKFSVEAGYNTSSSSNDKYMYAMQEIQHIVGSHYVRGGMMRHLAQTNPSVMQTTFTNAVKKLQTNPNDKSAMASLIKNYGTHIITRGTLGGELKVSMQMKITDQTDASSIHAALGLSSKVIKVDGSFDMSNKESAVANNTTLSLQSYGGNNVYTIAPGTSFQDFQNTVKSTVKMNEWVSSIKDMSSLALIDMETIPIWDLMPTEEIRDALRNYVVGDYQRLIYGDDFKPDLYIVKGFKVEDAPGYGSIYLPEIDVEIQVESAIIPELSKDEFSTVVYSGSQGKVGRERGFFMGSATRKPCKFHRKKDGTFETEVFDRLTEAAITELYVDVSGDVTIATKSVSDLYQTVEITNWRNDISKLTKDWTAKSDLTITGKTNYCVSVADGVTLTLDTVTVNNQFVCLGNAQLVLKDNAKNVVKCTANDKAAIQAGPEGKTLTISGNGQLEVTSSENAAAIGTSANGKCGNIKIEGGTITATSGNNAAAIGSGNGGTCGNITITKDVIAVKATCGSGSSCVPIGAGDNGTCGTVTIEDQSKVEEINPNGTAFDVSTLTGNYTLTRNCQLTGTTEFAIKIPDGFTVTLNNVTIKNTLECAGNATIILKKGTTNTIAPKGNYCSTLLVGPTGTTLTIEGGGKLISTGKDDIPGIGGGGGRGGDIVINGGIIEAHGGWGGAGIGSNFSGLCGNITINGGEIYAYGGSGGSAGIGSGGNYNRAATCGNILITGGKIYAKGGSGGAAAIGSGARCNCGNITIKKTVTEVTVEKYNSSVTGDWIGAGNDGTCGTVTIEDGANVIQK